MESVKKRRRAQRNSLTRRWIRNAFGIIVVFLLLLEGAFAFMLRYYYYQSVQSALENRAELYQRTLELSESTESQTWQARSRELIAHFTDKDKMELQVLDAKGSVLLSSTGFVPMAAQSDGREVELSSGNRLWQGHNAAGEPIMALTVDETDTGNTRIGALRYVVSLRMVNRQIWLLSLVIFNKLSKDGDLTM